LLYTYKGNDALGGTEGKQRYTFSSFLTSPLDWVGVNTTLWP